MMIQRHLEYNCCSIGRTMYDSSAAQEIMMH